MRGLVVALLVLAACPAQGPQRLGASPSWRAGSGSGDARRTAVAGPVTFAPVTAPAARYNEPAEPAPRSELGDAVAGAVREAATGAGLAMPRPDARLFRACTELARQVLAQGMVSYPEIEFALQRNGIIEPAPELLIVWGDVTTPEPIVKELQPRLTGVLRDGATARLGIGAARLGTDSAGVAVFALQGSGVTTLPIPRAVSAGNRTTIDAVLDARYHGPEVFVTYADGMTEQRPLASGRAGGFVAQVDCSAHPGRQQIEITASDAAGATVLANFPVWCDGQPPQSVTVQPPRDEPSISSEDAERRLFTSVNRDRAAAGLPALVWDYAVAAVARNYSEEMRRTHLVAHISPTSGSAADRIRVASIKTGVVLENVARAYGVDEAHQALMDSPGHRANLMSTVATHLGIGVAIGDAGSGRREMFITQVFTRVPPPFNQAQAIVAVRDKLAAVRLVRNTATLDRLAQQAADGLAAGQPTAVAYQGVSSQLSGLGKDYRRVGSVITAVSDLDSIDGPALIGAATPDEIGLGIAQGPHPQLGDNAIWIVLLLGSRRTP